MPDPRVAPPAATTIEQETGVPVSVVDQPLQGDLSREAFRHALSRIQSELGSPGPENVWTWPDFSVASVSLITKSATVSSFSVDITQTVFHKPKQRTNRYGWVCTATFYKGTREWNVEIVDFTKR
jgi:hypothetical protein